MIGNETLKEANLLIKFQRILKKAFSVPLSQAANKLTWTYLASGEQFDANNQANLNVLLSKGPEP